ncbi:MAG: hypothetical protein U1G08_14575 [Verrucomicrobiota bacterium]
MANALALAFLTGCATEKAAVADLKQLKHDLSGLAGHVLIAGKPVAGSAVTLYAAGTGAPTVGRRQGRREEVRSNWTPSDEMGACSIWSPRSARGRRAAVAAGHRASSQRHGE